MKTDQTKELYVNARNKSKDILNKAKTDKWKEFISTLTYKANSKHIWNVIAKFNGKPFKPIEVLKANNTRYHDNKDKANALVNHYQQVSSDDLLEPTFRLRKRELEPDIAQTVNDCIMGVGGGDLFTFREMENALNKKKSTAPGADTVHYDMLRKASDKCKLEPDIAQTVNDCIMGVCVGGEGTVQ